MAKKSINIIVLVVIVATVCLLIFSVTYAWILASRSTNDLSNTAGGGNLDIVYQNGQDITGVLKPSKDNTTALSTTATIRKTQDSVDAVATINLNVTSISSELAISAFKWEVYKDSETVAISSGTFEGVVDNSVINLVDNYLLTTTDTIFTIKLWLNGDESDGSIVNKSISAYIDANAVNAPSSIN